ncbi:MAG: amino acid permease, partial [Clostridiales Family XIII bacterium]|nr:amino acid permease [Clostridiales Family XIII bacterium]
MQDSKQPVNQGRNTTQATRTMPTIIAASVHSKVAGSKKDATPHATPTKSLSAIKIIIMITTTVFSFSSMSNAFFLMGYKAIPWLILCAILYFVPFCFIIAEITSTYQNHQGGLYDWLADIVSPKMGFVAAFIWYCSYFIWMVSLFMKCWIPISIAIFGKDMTQMSQLPLGLSKLGLTNVQLIGVLSVALVIIVSIIILGGFMRVAKTIVFSGTLMSILMFLMIASSIVLFVSRGGVMANHFDISGSNSTTFFQTGTNISGSGIYGNLSFMIFGITAFGGLDTIANTMSEMGEKKKHFPRYVLIGAILIVAFYIFGIILWGVSIDWKNIDPSKFHLGNAMYYFVENL